MPGDRFWRASCFHGVEGRARRDAGRGVPLQGHRRVHVVALDQVGPGELADLHQGAQGDESARGGAHPQAVDVVLVDPEALVGLRPHLVHAAERVEVVHVGGAQVDAQGLEDVGDRDVEDAGLLAVDLEVDLGELAEKVVKTPVRFGFWRA